MDGTVLLKFRLRKSETTFQNPISFRANDYDSRNFYEEKGKIVFVTENGRFQRKKSCGTPDATPDEIETLFKQYSENGECVSKISNDILSLLDESLSHIELSGNKQGMILIQRNIYSGSYLEITRKEKKGLGISTDEDNFPEDIKPIGIRTNDFIALFSFCSLIEFRFGTDLSYVKFKSLDPRIDMEGIIALCTYDELGTISTCEGGRNGRREEQKNRRGECKPDTEVERIRRSRRSQG